MNDQGKFDVSRAYNVYNEPGYEGKVDTTFSEVYNQEGNAFVSMKVVIPGHTEFFVDFDNPDQVRDCYEAMGKYLGNRGNFRRLEAPEVGDLMVDYGRSPVK